MSNSKIVLLAEDNLDNRDLVRWTLESANLDIELIEAADGEEAFRLAKERKPALILMDMGMPVLDGWETTKRIRATSEIASIPIIALTAHALEEEKKRALAIGCTDFVTKPLDTTALIEKVQQYLS
ncbi:MAG TPA: response regulator [Bacteroidota bacterium]